MVPDLYRFLYQQRNVNEFFFREGVMVVFIKKIICVNLYEMLKNKLMVTEIMNTQLIA